MPHDLIPRNLRIGHQALFAFVDVLAKTFLTCVQNHPGICTTKPRSRQDPQRQVSQKRWHGHRGRFPGRRGGVVRPWSLTEGERAYDRPEHRGKNDAFAFYPGSQRPAGEAACGLTSDARERSAPGGLAPRNPYRYVF